jgi:hypothetical protein
MARNRKLVKLSIKETSGVDHPAHLHDGWVVMKSATPAQAEAVLDELRPTEIPDEATPVEVVAEVPTAETAEAEVLEDTTKAANAVLETLTNFTKEEIMSEVSEMTEVVIVPEAASEADILKAMPSAIRKMLDDASANAEAALRKAAASEAALVAEREARADEAAVIKAAGWSHLNIDPTIVGPALRRLSESDSVLAGEVVKALDSANAIAETNAVFTEVGSDAPVATDDAFSKMESLAKAAVAEGVAPSFEAALLAVAQSNPDLYTSYLNEKGR